MAKKSEIHFNPTWLDCTFPRAMGRAAMAGVLSILIASCTVGAPTPEQLFEKMKAAAQSVTYQGIRVLEIQHGPQHIILKQKAYFAPGGKQRFEVISPPEMLGDVAVADGTHHWRYSRKRNEVRVFQFPLWGGHMIPMLPDQCKSLRNNTSWRVAGQTKLAGREAWVLVLVGPQEKQLAKLTVDQEKYVVLAAEHHRMRGAGVEKWHFESVRFPPRLDANLFSFQPPPGAKVIRGPFPPQKLPLAEAEKRLGIEALVPRYLPPGYTMVKDGVGVIRRGPYAALWMMFKSDARTFSIFQSKRLPGNAKPPHAVARWDVGPYTLIVVGDINSAEAEKIRRSLPPISSK
jgi:outer membrane lipoprotein-sorting protein